MRTSAVAFAALLLLLLLATRAHGIRLDRQLHEAINSKQQMADPKSGAAIDATIADSVKKHCTPDGRCSGAKVKKALAHSDETAEAKPQQQQASSTGNGHATTVDSEATQQQARHEAEAASHGPSQDASASVVTRRLPRQRQTYPDLMDIAGMDYSPATRKPPIHN
ncbi:hypothetical protein BAE44_0004608 [Dichanthelium oligosanthes]|uniref:Uncharacterized protein n=1 Tax=Dichanthelium oligosanthes TaxID=888268 RepID=A0A1E5WAD6_9POAL|nr:hypothetical protein BAE44_0004608 [Dichanthelium oligosanthes]